MTPEDIERSKAIIQRIFQQEVRYFNNLENFYVLEWSVMIAHFQSEWTAEHKGKVFNGYSLARVCLDMKRWIGNQRVMRAIKEGEL